MSTRQFSIDARTVPFPRQGWESSGRQIPTFVLVAHDAASAAYMAVRVLMDAHPDTQQASATASERGVPGEPETASHTAQRVRPGPALCRFVVTTDNL